MKLELAQFAPVFPGHDENWRRIRTWAEQSPADIILFPELSSCGYMYEDLKEVAPNADAAEALAPLEKLSSRTGKLIVGGFAERAGARLYNAAYAVGPDGTNVYRKIHLWNREKILFREGRQPCLVEFQGRKVGLEICYDLQFPELAAYLARHGAELIVAPTAWARDAHGPSHGLEPHAFLALASAYANGICVAVANRTGRERGAWFPGQSCLSGPWGTITTLGSDEERRVLDVPFDEMREAQHPSAYNHLKTDAQMTIRPPARAAPRPVAGGPSSGPPREAVNPKSVPTETPPWGMRRHQCVPWGPKG